MKVFHNLPIYYPQLQCIKSVTSKICRWIVVIIYTIMDECEKKIRRKNEKLCFDNKQQRNCKQPFMAMKIFLSIVIYACLTPGKLWGSRLDTVKKGVEWWARLLLFVDLFQSGRTLNFFLLSFSGVLWFEIVTARNIRRGFEDNLDLEEEDYVTPIVTFAKIFMSNRA